MFIDGIKTAAVGGVGKAVGTALGKTKGYLAEDVAQTFRRMKQRTKAFQSGYESGKGPRVNPASGKAKPATGETLAKKQMEHALPPPEMAGKAQQEYLKKGIKSDAAKSVKERAGKAEKGKKGPGFAMRHPFLTAGAGLMTAKYLMDGQKKSQDGQYGAALNNPVSPY